jgi:Flp pilus assembly protein TadD
MTLLWQSLNSRFPRFHETETTMVQLQQQTKTIFQDAVSSHNAGLLTEAAQGYQRVLQDDPMNADALHLLGVLLGQSGDTKAGVSLINQAVEVRPNFPQAFSNLGLLLQNAGEIDQAILAYSRAVRLNPSDAKACNNLAICFSDLGRIDSAIGALKKGIATGAKSEALYDNACKFLKRQNNFSACIKMADAGLRHFPEHARLWSHRADACFALGRFDEAWEAYSWRNRNPENPNTVPSYPIPYWQGEDLSDLSILVWTEQGPGETFLFSSMLNEIIAAAKKCTLITTARLRPILARSFPNADVFDGDAYRVTSDTADVQSSLIDLSRWLRRSWSDFPTLPPHIKPDPVRVSKSQQLSGHKNGNPPTVGVAWNSLNVTNASLKSLSLEALHPILSVPGVKFVSLQYGDTDAEINQFKTLTGIDIGCELGIDPVADLEGHLAQIATLDLVISTSNTTVHGAAAQGIPTWVLLPHTLGEGLYWPWFVNLTTSPWYPSVQLYRQDTQGDWSAPVHQTAIDLAHWSAKKGAQFDLDEHRKALAATIRTLPPL